MNRRTSERKLVMQKIQIHLEKVTEDNVEDIVKLRVAKDQQDYIASNDWSLIDAYLALAERKPVFPFGIYNGKTLVGFIMISYQNNWEGYEHDSWINSDEYQFYKNKPYYYIWRFMIDKRFQRHGYGRAALECAIDFVRSFPCGEAEYCVLSYNPKNETAKNFYSSVGFKEFNRIYFEEDDELSAVLKL